MVEAIGFWGQKWVESAASLKNLDPSLLMWDMRRNLDPNPLPNNRTVVQFIYTDLPKSKSHWWLVVEPHGEVDLCWSDPGFEVDLCVTTDLRTMTAVWMGITSIKAEGGKFHMTGSPLLAKSMQTWMGLSPFALEKKLVS